MNSSNRITVYEYQTLKVGEVHNSVEFTPSHLKNFEKFYGENGVPYYSLINHGIRFKEYVGVLNVGGLTIEVLPKADKFHKENEWRNVLIGMMRAVGAFNIQAPSSSSLNLKTNFILDLYFELFVKEVEYLVNKGLIKKYRKKDSNSFALKGNIMFGQHIQKNLVHQERFFVRHTTYDQIHVLHQIIYKTLKLLHHINNNVDLKSRIGNLLLHFPEVTDIKVTDSTFDKMVLNRKTEDYKNALSISRLLLLKYHPDVSKGQNDVLALMFDMNVLWEKFIYVSLRKGLPEKMSITAQTSMNFWKPKSGYNSTMKPDVVIYGDNGETYVIDTKWKNISDDNPSPEDLRQLFVYHEYFEAEKVALLYPGNESVKSGYYYQPKGRSTSNKECSIIKVPTFNNVNDWQQNIRYQIFNNWLHLKRKILNTETSL